MEIVPHLTLDQNDYERIKKKDNGSTIIEFKLPPGFETILKKPLDAVDEDDDYENDANLDIVLESSRNLRRSSMVEEKKEEKEKGRRHSASAQITSRKDDRKRWWKRPSQREVQTDSP